jgi:hypothetical protein
MTATLLAHNVYFSLHDRSAPACERLVQACRALLVGHPGIVFFACGTLAGHLRREVNDLDFDVALHIVFADSAAHDAYQAAPTHLQFIAENKDSWKRVRVFDSLVVQSPATTSKG